MRQIKFRAWNHVTKKYFTPSELRYENGEFVYTTACDGKFALEQFTGLYDKNGKEIYEGDLFYRKNINDEIEYLEVCFAVHQGGFWIKGCGYLTEDAAKVFEIIGNIHENPELNVWDKYIKRFDK